MSSSDHLLLTRDKLDVGTISALVSNDSCGAISLFVGTTRDNFEGKRVCSLEYEAYEPMAIKEMQNICTTIRTRWIDVADIAIHHRIGLVPVREASVVIAISSPHRQSALDAVALAIEQLKQKVPIWKKELYEGDESTWKENKESAIITSKKCDNVDITSLAVDVSPVPIEMVQISAEEQEIDKRIKSFIQRKREAIDFNNIMDYTEVGKIPHDSSGKSAEDFGETSARTNTHIVKQENSKCHLKVRRARNDAGPQIQPKYLHTLDKLLSHEPSTNSSSLDIDKSVLLSDALQKRLESVEDYLHLSPLNAKRSIYARMKQIEDRIMHLESISPEYWQSMTDAGMQQSVNSNQKRINKSKHKTYTANDLNAIIDQMEKHSESKKQ